MIGHARRLIGMLDDIHKYSCPVIPVMYDADKTLLDFSRLYTMPSTKNAPFPILTAMPKRLL